MPVATSAPSLTVQRLSPVEWPTFAAGTPALGSLGYGETPAASGIDAVRAPVLSASGPQVDAWLGGNVVHAGRCGSVCWRSDGHWLYGSIELDEVALQQPLAALAHQAYRELFETLQSTGFPQLLRVWNYMADINAEQDGLERYRHFNSGRQMAFLEAGQAAFEGAPVACALGVPNGPLCVRFLAGRVPPTPVENPRQVSAYHYPPSYGPRSPSFSRAALLPTDDGCLALLVSGTASIVGHQSLHPGDVKAQTAEILANLQALVNAAHERCTARFSVEALQSVVYVRHAHDAALVMEVLAQALGVNAPCVAEAVMLQADICRADLLVEIEAHGFAQGELKA